MGVALRPIALEEFLAWEAAQEERYEFDGTQPVAMTGASFAHARLVTRLIGAMLQRLRPGCLPLANHLKVVAANRVRYPDLTVVCGEVAGDADRVAPIAVFEVLSPSTALTDRRVKPRDYAAAPSVAVYVILEQDRPCAYVLRRERDWAEEVLEGAGAAIALPEIGVELPVSELYRS